MALDVNNSAANAMLLAYQNERDVWLAHTRQMLEKDSRVVAAWLFGSLGRGAADELSDVDIFVVLADACAETVMANRREHLCASGEPLLLLDAPQNRPSQGAYNMALYAGQYGPHQVDWYWQPQSCAAIPKETRLLFDRAGLPRLDTPPHFEYQSVPERARTESLVQAVNFFWVMLLIAAKYAARKPEEAGLGLLSYPLSSLREVYAFTKETAPMPFADEVSCPNFAAKLRLMRDLAADMERQMFALQAQGIDAPTAIVPFAYRYFDLAEAVRIR